MERRGFQTPLGEIWLWGEPEAFSGSRPIVLVIHGAFQAERSVFFNLPSYHPEAAVLLAHLPGNHCPELVSADVVTYATAIDHVLRGLGRPVLIVGVSTGAVVALALTAPDIFGFVLVEPPLRTDKLWPLMPTLLGKSEPWARRFVEGVFNDRDYTPLLRRLSRRAWVLLGDEPLMPERPVSQLPSLVDEPERELLRAHPLVRIAVAEGVGHNLPEQASPLIDAALTAMLEAVTSVRP